MHLEFLHAVEGLLAHLAGEILFGLPLGSPAPPGGRHEFGFLQDVWTGLLGTRGHGTLRQSGSGDGGAGPDAL